MQHTNYISLIPLIREIVLLELNQHLPFTVYSLNLLYSIDFAHVYVWLSSSNWTYLLRWLRDIIFSDDE